MGPVFFFLHGLLTLPMTPYNLMTQQFFCMAMPSSWLFTAQGFFARDSGVLCPRKLELVQGGEGATEIQGALALEYLSMNPWLAH